MQIGSDVEWDMTNKQNGFTLVELMIVVAVISLLAMIATSSYNSQTTKSRRAAAESFMLEVANRQDRYVLDTRQYAADMATLGMTVPAEVSANYTVTTAAVAGPPLGYTVQAVPIGTQLSRDTTCGTLGLNSAGAKTPTTSGCW